MMFDFPLRSGTKLDQVCESYSFIAAADIKVYVSFHDRNTVGDFTDS